MLGLRRAVGTEVVHWLGANKPAYKLEPGFLEHPSFFLASREHAGFHYLPAASLLVLGLEGIVSKRRDLPYRSGRCKAWIKIKNPASPAVLRIHASPLSLT
jgi:hypothetical protein